MTNLFLYPMNLVVPPAYLQSEKKRIWKRVAFLNSRSVLNFRKVQPNLCYNEKRSKPYIYAGAQLWILDSFLAERPRSNFVCHRNVTMLPMLYESDSLQAVTRSRLPQFKVCWNKVAGAGALNFGTQGPILDSAQGKADLNFKIIRSEPSNNQGPFLLYISSWQDGV